MVLGRTLHPIANLPAIAWHRVVRSSLRLDNCRTRIRDGGDDTNVMGKFASHTMPIACQHLAHLGHSCFALSLRGQRLAPV